MFDVKLYCENLSLIFSRRPLVERAPEIIRISEFKTSAKVFPE